MKPLSLLLVLCALLISCASDDSPERHQTGKAPGDTVSQPGSDAAGPPSSPVQLWKGFYVFGHQANLFRPCGSEIRHWVVAERRAMEQLKMKYAQLAIEPYEEIYMEARGRVVEEPAAEGVDAGYETQFQIEEMVSLRKKKDGDCPDSASVLR